VPLENPQWLAWNAETGLNPQGDGVPFSYRLTQVVLEKAA